MNFSDALYFLEFDLNTNLTLDIVTKRYRKLALKYHPDKNGDTEQSNEHFKKINEAYDLLKKSIIDYTTDDEIDDYNTRDYINVLTNFINSVIDGNYTDIITKIINEILKRGKNVSLKLFEGLDKETALNIYSFLSKYKNLLHLQNNNTIDNELLEHIQNIVTKKYENVVIYKINVPIINMLNNICHKLYHMNEIYIVPSWNRENYYEDSNGNEIIVICEPIVHDDMYIDEENNLHVSLKINTQQIIDNISNDEPLIFFIGDQHYFVPLSELYIKKEQFYRLKGKGLVNVNKDDLYDLTNKLDIIVNIKIETLRVEE